MQGRAQGFAGSLVSALFVRSDEPGGGIWLKAKGQHIFFQVMEDHIFVKKPAKLWICFNFHPTTWELNRHTCFVISSKLQTPQKENCSDWTRDVVVFFPQTVYCWGSILEKKSWPHSLAAPLNSVAGLCVQVLSSSVAWLCVRVLSFSCPCLGRVPELCGWSLWPGLLERSLAEQIAMSMPTKLH